MKISQKIMTGALVSLFSATAFGASHSTTAFALASAAINGDYSEQLLDNGNRLGKANTFCQNFRYNKSQVLDLLVASASDDNRVAAEGDFQDGKFARDLNRQIGNLCRR